MKAQSHVPVTGALVQLGMLGGYALQKVTEGTLLNGPAKLSLYFFNLRWFEGDISFLTSVLVIVLCAMFGALVPDIDHPKSTLGRYVPWLGTIIGHRTLTHTIYAVIILAVIGIIFFRFQYWYWAFIIGYTLHIVEDSFSPQGIDWFNPNGYVTRYRNGKVVSVMKKNRNRDFILYSSRDNREMYIRNISKVIIVLVSIFWVYIAIQML